MKRPRSRLTGLHDSLAAVLGEDSLELLTSIAQLRRHWPDIVGTMMAARTEPVSIERLKDQGLCLLIGVDHPIMAQQIRFLRNDIRQACFRHARVANLQQIRTRIQPGAGIRSKHGVIRKKPVHFGAKRAIAKELASIKDRRLKRAMFEARVAQMAFANDLTHEETS